MGYHAPCAEDVYRYVFRVDRRSQHTLSDGFSWSILFVNDSSAKCQEFLLRYGAELCYRTADRIRFVFFSGLDPRETDSLMQQGVPGLLSRVIRAAASWASPRRRYDWEHDPWNDFRPDAFRPLDSHDRIHRQVRDECEIYSAMPGSREALRFAQNLGIGRLVPCFVMFSDVGSPVIRVLPFGHLTPDQAFERLRHWIDSFYEINNPLLGHWKQVEVTIEQICERFRAPIYRVEQWRRERTASWQLLQQVSRHLVQLMHTSPSTESLKTIVNDGSVPWTIQTSLRPHLQRLESLESQASSADLVSGIIDSLRRKPLEEARVLQGLAGLQRHWDGLPRELRALIASATPLFKMPRRPTSPEQQLHDWWQSEHGRPPSRNQHNKHRRAWSHYSTAKHGRDAIGNTGKILKDEFAVVQQVLLAQPFTCAPEHAAGEAIASLAAHLGALPEDDTWREATAAYHQFLSNYLARLQEHAPRWLLDLEGWPSQPTWADCVPTAEQRQRRKRHGLLTTLPLLAGILPQVTEDWDARASVIERERGVAQQRALDQIAERTRAWCASALSIDANKHSIWLEIITTFSRMRGELEEQIFTNNRGDALPLSETLTRSDAAHLMRVLDTYKNALASFYLPYERDPDVLKISLDLPPVVALGLAPSIPSVNSPEPARQEVSDAIDHYEASLKDWPSIKRKAISCSPGGSLCAALGQVVPKERLEELLATIDAKSLDDVPDTLYSRSRITPLLDQLNVHELLGVERLLNAGFQTNKVASKQELHEAVLIAIGLPSLPDNIPAAFVDGSGAERLREKVTRGAFDIFLAHNSKDTSTVQRLGRELRARGIYPWIDVEQIPPGRWVQDVLQSAVRNVRSAAVLIGTSGVGKWQALELRAFMDLCVSNQIPLIPVLLPGTSIIPEDLVFLRQLNIVTFSRDVDEKEPIARLIWGITGQKPPS